MDQRKREVIDTALEDLRSGRLTKDEFRDAVWAPLEELVQALFTGLSSEEQDALTDNAWQRAMEVIFEVKNAGQFVAEFKAICSNCLHEPDRKAEGAPKIDNDRAMDDLKAQWSAVEWAIFEAKFVHHRSPSELAESYEMGEAQIRQIIGKLAKELVELIRRHGGNSEWP